MATETRTTTEREDAPTGVDDAVRDARNLGYLEGQVSILLRNVEEHKQQTREDYRALDAKIDTVDAKIDTVDAKIDSKIDGVNARIDGVNAGLSARIDRLFYWMLGLCVAIIITIVGSAIGLAIRLG